MLKKLVILLLLVNLTLLPSVSLSSSANSQLWWDEEWSFNQKIGVPIDTSSENAKFQPVDIHLEFDHPCWAKNEKEHAVRVVFQEGETLKEIESQIYDLTYKNNNLITACNLVFLIPEEANGNENYYAYYDDDEKTSPNYPNHVDVEESYYRYEPIPGYPFESRYYKITEDEYIVYAVAQEGKYMGLGAAQQATKLKTKTKEVMPQNGEACASFEFWYYYGQGIKEYSSTIEQLISKEIFVDGNLMVEFGIVSGTSREDVQTVVTYKYYYCPTENKRLCAHVRHKALKECDVAPGTNFDGVYMNLQCGGIKSNAIKELNFGEIPLYLHVYTEQGILREYTLDPDPEYVPDDWNIRVLNTEHDVDLGDKAWASFDEGETGAAHALILGANSVIISGTDERDGVQVKAHESDYPHLPGFECDTATFQYGRNSYERGASHDLEIPDDFVVEFDAEFFSTESGGYKSVEREAEIFQSLVKIRPLHGREVSGDDIEEDKYSLTTYIHLAPSFPMGSAFSTLTGKKFSYISAELYSEGTSISSDIGRRLSVNPPPSFEDTNLIEKIRLAIDMFDWRDFTFFKKVRFQNLHPGRYLIKIYKENPLFGEERRYIGFQIVDITEDAKTHVLCKSEGEISVSVFDQHDEGIEDASIWLLSGNTVIATGLTDQNGLSTINAPCNLLETYVLKIVYNGFVIHEEAIRLGYIASFVPIKKSINTELYDFTLKLTDKWGLTPEIELNPIIVNDEMQEPIMIVGEKISKGEYRFSGIYPGIYRLELKYKSFVLEENIQVPSEGDISLVFPAEYTVKTSVLDARGKPLHDTKIRISREDKSIEKCADYDGFSSFSLPPGVYTAAIYHDGELIGMRKITILGERTINMITSKEPLYPIIIISIVGLFVAASVYLALKKKDIIVFLKIGAIALAVGALVYPWWVLHGSTSSAETTTRLFLLPTELVTVTISSNVIAGELASLPDIFVNAMNLLLALITACVLLIISSIILKRFGKQRLSLLFLSYAVLVLIGSIILFTYGMSQLTEPGFGGFLGAEKQDIMIPGEGTYETLFCSWGPGIGFYLCLSSALIILFVTILNFKKMLKR